MSKRRRCRKRMPGRSKEAQMIRELRNEIMAAVLLIGSYDDLMAIYSDILARRYTDRK